MAGTVIKIAVAVVAAYTLWRIGLAMLANLARGVPEPPPPGELRKINLQYRCSVCGAELRMTRASEELPPPPRHCQEEMDLVAPID